MSKSPRATARAPATSACTGRVTLRAATYATEIAASDDEDQQHVDRRGQVVHLRLDLAPLHDQRQRQRVVLAAHEVDRRVDLDELRRARIAACAQICCPPSDDVRVDVARQPLRLRRARRRDRGGSMR